MNYAFQFYSCFEQKTLLSTLNISKYLKIHRAEITAATSFTRHCACQAALVKTLDQVTLRLGLGHQKYLKNKSHC